MNKNLILSFCISGAINIDDYTSKVLENNLLLKSKKFEIEAIISKNEYYKAKKLPELKFDAQGRLFTHKNEMEIPNPLRPTQTTKIEIGDTKTLSAGLTINQIIYDGGFISKNEKATENDINSTKFENEKLKNTIREEAKRKFIIYYKAQEKLKLVEDTLKLALLRNQDIEKKYKLGVLNKLDLLQSNKEIIIYKFEKEHALQNIDEAKNNFFKLIYCENNLNNIFELKNTTSNINEIKEINFNSSNEILAQSKKAESLFNQGESVKSLLYPQIIAQGRVSVDYPDNNKKEFYNNNAIAINISIPIFEFEKTKKQANEIIFKSNALNEKIKDDLNTLKISFANLKLKLNSTKEELILANASINESQEIANLQLNLYKQGKSQYIDVQNANQKLLEAKIQKNDLELKEKLIEFSLENFYENTKSGEIK